jgi:hypothetical protein
MKKLITIIATSVLLFGCAKEDNSTIKAPITTQPDTIDNTYAIQITCTSGTFLVTTKYYSPNEKESVLAMNVTNFKKTWVQKGKKYMYFYAKSQNNTSGLLELRLLKNGSSISYCMSGAKSGSCIIDGTY